MFVLGHDLFALCLRGGLASTVLGEDGGGGMVGSGRHARFNKRKSVAIEAVVRRNGALSNTTHIQEIIEQAPMRYIAALQRKM